MMRSTIAAKTRSRRSCALRDAVEARNLV